MSLFGLINTLHRFKVNESTYHIKGRAVHPCLDYVLYTETSFDQPVRVLCTDFVLTQDVLCTEFVLAHIVLLI